MGFAEDLVKIELHCHLDGSMEVSDVQQLLEAQGTVYTCEELEKRLKVSSDCTSLTEYLEKFDLPLSCLQTKEGLYRAAVSVVRAAARDNVRYMEVRFAPMLSLNAGLNCREVIESVVEGLKAGGRQYGVYASAIVCAMRHHLPEKNMEMLRTAREFLGNGVCALDLAGDESAFPTSMFRDLFAQAQKWRVPFTIHSGECGSIENVKEAIALGAQRLGHGIALQKSRELQRVCADKGIGIEMCPTSNLQTKAVDSYEQYPLADFLEHGLAVSINTDNRTVSGTDMTKEIMLVTELLHQDEEAVRTCMKHAVRTSFADDDIKDKLWKML